MAQSMIDVIGWIHVSGQEPVPDTYGYTATYENIGSADNKKKDATGNMKFCTVGLGVPHSYGLILLRFCLFCPFSSAHHLSFHFHGTIHGLLNKILQNPENLKVMSNYMCNTKQKHSYNGSWESIFASVYQRYSDVKFGWKHSEPV